jgi:hypothetical protein
MTAPVVFFELLRAQRLGAHACERRNSALAGGTGCRRELDSLPQAATILNYSRRVQLNIKKGPDFCELGVSVLLATSQGQTHVRYRRVYHRRLSMRY